MPTRFWQTVAVEPATPGFALTLDGKPLRLPSGARLLVSHPRLAEAVAEEWRQAPAVFTQLHLGLTGLAGATQERVLPNQAAMAATLARYAEADLLCYRAAAPEGLASAQHATWQPWLDWARDWLGADLRTTTGIAHIQQPQAALAAIHAVLARHSPETLAALGLAMPAFGSCVLGLALAARASDPATLFAAAMTDETFQEQRWGTDAESAARRARLQAEIALAARFMELSDAWERNG